MYCQNCAHELPSGATACPACGYAVPGMGAHAGSSAASSIDQVLHDTKQAAKELAASAGKLSERLVAKAGTAAKDPAGSAKKAVKRVAHELEEAAHEIDRIVREL